MNRLFLEKFSVIERNLSKEKGATQLFALIQTEESPGSWDVVISSKGLPDDGKNLENLRFAVNKINEVLDKTEIVRVSKVVLLDPNQPFLKELEHFLERNGNPREFSHCEINGMKIKHAHIIVSPVADSKTFVTKATVTELQQQINFLEQVVKRIFSQQLFQHLKINAILQEPSQHFLGRKTELLEGSFSTLTDPQLFSIEDRRSNPPSTVINCQSEP